MATDDEHGRSDQRDDDAANDTTVHRRTVLKATGLVTAAGLGLGQVGTARSADTTAGFGEGGYGEGGYGTVESESSLAVTTDAATDVGKTSVTLNGSLTDLGGADSADVAFEYRPTGGTWATSAATTLSATGSVSQSVSDLTSGTEYEYRLTAVASDGATATGSTATVTTQQNSTELPNTVVIDGIDDTGGSKYRFTVSGDVEKSAALSSGSDASPIDERSDTVSDGTVEGQVKEGVDGYRYAGEITSFQLNGNATVTIDDTDG